MIQSEHSVSQYLDQWEWTSLRATQGQQFICVNSFVLRETCTRWRCSHWESRWGRRWWRSGCSCRPWPRWRWSASREAPCSPCPPPPPRSGSRTLTSPCHRRPQGTPWTELRFPVCPENLFSFISYTEGARSMSKSKSSWLTRALFFLFPQAVKPVEETKQLVTVIRVVVVFCV